MTRSTLSTNHRSNHEIFHNTHHSFSPEHRRLLHGISPRKKRRRRNSLNDNRQDNNKPSSRHQHRQNRSSPSIIRRPRLHRINVNRPTLNLNIKGLPTRSRQRRSFSCIGRHQRVRVCSPHVHRLDASKFSVCQCPCGCSADASCSTGITACIAGTRHPSCSSGPCRPKGDDCRRSRNKCQRRSMRLPVFVWIDAHAS